MKSDRYFLAITAIQNRLHAYILSLLADPVAAQDVLQETNLVLIRKADDFQSDATVPRPVASAPPNPTRLLTQRGLLNRERESLATDVGESRAQRRSRATSRELSQPDSSPPTLARVAENDQRRELSLSASCVHWLVGGNSAFGKSSPKATLFVTILSF